MSRYKTIGTDVGAQVRESVTWSQPHRRVLGGGYFSRSSAVSLMTCGFSRRNLSGSRGIESGTFCQKKSQSNKGCNKKQFHQINFWQWTGELHSTCSGILLIVVVPAFGIFTFFQCILSHKTQISYTSTHHSQLVDHSKHPADIYTFKHHSYKQSLCVCVDPVPRRPLWVTHSNAGSIPNVNAELSQWAAV